MEVRNKKYIGIKTVYSTNACRLIAATAMLRLLKRRSVDHHYSVLVDSFRGRGLRLKKGEGGEGKPMKENREVSRDKWTWLATLFWG